MFSFLKPKRADNRPQHSALPTSVSPNSSMQPTNLRRELIRVVLKDTLRLQGIPFGWLACEVLIIPREPGEDAVHIQLIVMKWNEKLLRYALALQHQLLLGLDRFDPLVDHSKYIVSWRFSPNCGCPFTKMPDPKTWLQSDAPQTADEPLSVLDRRHARRPAAEPEKHSDDYLPTQLTPLQ